jgi:hypothetical protein
VVGEGPEPRPVEELLDDAREEFHSSTVASGPARHPAPTGGPTALAEEHVDEGQWKRRSRRLFPTTNSDDAAIAAPAIIGSSSPAAARGIAATL